VNELGWRFRSACKGAPTGIFITPGDEDDDPVYPPPEAKRYCDMCPVTAECLAEGTLHDEVGVWGGMTKYQRDQLTRDRERSKCPGCGASDGLIVEGNMELCVGCGVSWHTF
jgi:hypothetical protein